MTVERQDFREQLAEVRRTRFANIPRVRPVMQMFLPSVSPCAESRRLAVHTVLDWAAGKWRGLVPAEAWKGEDFGHDRPGLKLAAVSLPDKGVWGFSVEHLDADATHPRTWVTEAIVAELGHIDVLAVRNECSSASVADVPATTPRFVRQWVDRLQVADAGRRLCTSGTVVNDEAEVERLVALLRHRERQLPVVVVSELPPGNGTYAIDPEVLARRTIALAHIFCLPAAQTYALSDWVGKELSVFNGAVRTYLPGFGQPNDTQVHVNVLAPRIAGWQGDTEVGGNAFVDFLVAQLHRFSVNTPQKLEQHPGFARLRRQKTDAVWAARLAEVEARSRAIDARGGKDPAAEIELLRLRVDENAANAERVARERDEQAKRADDAEQLFEMIDLELSAARNELESLRAQNATLFDALKRSRKPITEIRIPDGYEELAAWVDEHFADRVLLLPRAKRALKGAAFEDVPLVYKCIQLLAQEYWSLRTASPADFDKARHAFESKMRALQVNEAPSISATRVGEVEEQYTVDYTMGQSSRQLLDRHLRGGSNAKNDRYCLRVYFFWDDERQRVVIGHLPGHLDTRAT